MDSDPCGPRGVRGGQLHPCGAQHKCGVLRPPRRPEALIVPPTPASVPPTCPTPSVHAARRVPPIPEPGVPGGQQSSLLCRSAGGFRATDPVSSRESTSRHAGRVPASLCACWSPSPEPSCSRVNSVLCTPRGFRCTLGSPSLPVLPVLPSLPLPFSPTAFSAWLLPPLNRRHTSPHPLENGRHIFPK